MDTTLQILEKVDTFYWHTFTYLIYLACAIFALGGVAMPLVLRWMEERRARIDREQLRDQLQAQITSGITLATNEMNKQLTDALNNMKTQLDKAINDEIVRIQKQLKEEVSRLENQIKKESNSALGVAFMVQGISSLNENKYVNATKAYSNAAEYCLTAEDELNSKRSIYNLLNSCINHLNSTNFENDIELVENLDSLLASLNSLNQNGRYTDDIREIKNGIEKAKKNKS